MYDDFTKFHVIPKKQKVNKVLRSPRFLQRKVTKKILHKCPQTTLWMTSSPPPFNPPPPPHLIFLKESATYVPPPEGWRNF